MNGPTFPPEQPPLCRLDFEYVRALVRKASAIVLDDSKTYLVVSRLLPIARSNNFDTVGALISHLQCTPQGDLHATAVEAIATTETSFFRDLHPFVALRDEILPELIQRRSQSTRTLSIWSAGCSSGQEPHSIAMILRDRFSSIAGWNLQLHASDLSNQMVERARLGTYSQLEVNRGLPAPYLVRFFDQIEDRWVLKEDVRRMFRFFQQNLAEEWSTVPQVDVLLLRNVLIYFDVATRRRALRQVRRLLRPDGYLLLGSAETTLNLDELFDRVRVGRAVFYQVSKGAGG
ncbi:MAG: protein-glutamate O-methyltransferase CheR [Thermoanaerobaculales bacterium]|nr:protein-glutamate O-methyltransferase CheR [Thermoanaerobaculales bacterium]